MSNKRQKNTRMIETNRNICLCVCVYDLDDVIILPTDISGGVTLLQPAGWTSRVFPWIWGRTPRLKPTSVWKIERREREIKAGRKWIERERNRESTVGLCFICSQQIKFWVKTLLSCPGWEAQWISRKQTTVLPQVVGPPIQVSHLFGQVAPLLGVLPNQCPGSLHRPCPPRRGCSYCDVTWF